MYFYLYRNKNIFREQRRAYEEENCTEAGPTKGSFGSTAARFLPFVNNKVGALQFWHFWGPKSRPLGEYFRGKNHEIQFKVCQI